GSTGSSASTAPVALALVSHLPSFFAAPLLVPTASSDVNAAISNMTPTHRTPRTTTGAITPESATKNAAAASKLKTTVPVAEPAASPQFQIRRPAYRKPVVPRTATTAITVPSPAPRGTSIAKPTMPTTSTAAQYKLKELTTTPVPTPATTATTTIRTPAPAPANAVHSIAVPEPAASRTIEPVYSPSADQPVVAAPSRARPAAEALATAPFTPACIRFCDPLTHPEPAFREETAIATTSAASILVKPTTFKSVECAPVSHPLSSFAAPLLVSTASSKDNGRRATPSYCTTARTPTAAPTPITSPLTRSIGTASEPVTPAAYTVPISAARRTKKPAEQAHHTTATTTPVPTSAAPISLTLAPYRPSAVERVTPALGTATAANTVPSPASRGTSIATPTKHAAAMPSV
ncbi:hypothetical protein H0H81_005105, partial [Sphagnurus paluster]